MVLQCFTDTAMLFDQKADYIFQTDSDGQTNPDEFEPFWNQRGRYDAVIGNRDSSWRWKIQEVCGECGVLSFKNDLWSEGFGCQCAVSSNEDPDLVAKVYRQSFRKTSIFRILCLPTYFVHYKEKVKFIEISFKPRQGGTNSINVKKIVKIGWKAVKDFYKLKKEL